MRLKILIISVILSFMLALPVFSHFDDDANDVNSYTWNPQLMISLQIANELSSKSTITFGEAVRFLMLTIHGHYLNFEEDLAYLVRQNIAQGIKLKENDEINLGTLSLMTARTLKLKNSLFFNIFGTKRYAVRACADAGLINNTSGVHDKVSGEEFVELMRKIARAWGLPQ